MIKKLEKRQILEIIKSLQKIHHTIQKIIEDEKFEKIFSILTDCQESAISVGEIIEETEGAECVTVKYLEDYCETIYMVSQKLEEGISGRTAFILLHDRLEKVKTSIEEDIEIRREVVFFPYNASMWDSLESVYLAAREDPGCDAYCIPIPYYDKNPDGSFREVHFEADKYPSDIEITDWKSYSFEDRHPDAIYIHNPYDEFNFVTSVHPRFYASNLCQYTEMLVYIPYFVLGEIESDNQEVIDGISHFCFTPGTIYANKVILQSENIRQIYINEYMKVVKEQGKQIDRKELEERFLGLGSPKFDKKQTDAVLGMKIPEEWKKMIIKQDGRRKKIILYNTSVAGLLNKDKKMIKKIKSVFSIFEENRNEVVLWWRPHPLTEATIVSMRPKLWEEYNILRKQYIEKGLGIYDDSAELHRAIEVSDAYYGDTSSVVQLYEQTGKPIMIQNVDIE